MNHTFTTDELTTNATIIQNLNRKGSSSNSYTKLTMQVIDGGNPSTAGTIIIKAKVDRDNTNSSFQQIGQFDLTAKVPIFIQGTYEELQFIGASMTAEGADLLTNGNFSVPLGGEWTLTPGADGTISLVGGEMVIDQGATAEIMKASQAFTTVIGEHYTITFDLVSASNDAAQTRLIVGSTSGASDVAINNINSIGNGQKCRFIAIGTTTHVTVEDAQTVAGSTSRWDNISAIKTGSSAFIVIAATR